MIAYVDKLTVYSMMKLVRCDHNIEQVYSFDGMTRLGTLLYRILYFLGLVTFSVSVIQQYLGEVLLESGRDIGENNAHIELDSLMYFDEYVYDRELVESVGYLFGDLQIIKKYLFLEFFNYIKIPCWQIVMASLLNLEKEQSVIIFTASGDPLYLAEFAQRHNVMHASYEDSLLGKDNPIIKKILLVRQLTLCLIGVGFETLLYSIGASSENKSDDTTEFKVVQHYSGSSISRDMSDKFELFWLQDKNIQMDKVIVADYDTDCSTDGAIDYYKKKGMLFFGKSNDATCWMPTDRYVKMKKRIALKLSLSFFRAVCANRRVNLFIFKRLLLLSKYYSYWFDFYKQNNVRVISAIFFHDVSKVLAIDSLQGIAVSYQGSISNYLYAPTGWSKTHIAFTTSRYFSQLFSRSDLSGIYLAGGYPHPIHNAVHVGKEKITNLRKALEESGAKHIICFFDESLLDCWWTSDPSVNIAVYRKLFQLVLDNPEIGLICKPKNMGLIFDHLAPIRDVVDAALTTGRCHVFQSKKKYRGTYPCIAAAAADICIGDMVGGTASLEAFLVGKKSLLLNHYNWRPYLDAVSLQGKVVFPDIDSLIDSMLAYFEDPRAIHGFGDWTPWLKTLLSHVDDAGPERISAVLRRFLEEQDRGKTREQILTMICEEFAERWGDDCVTLTSGGAS